MSTFRTVLSRMLSLFRRRTLEREMDEEIRSHLDREAEHQVARGLTPAEARYAARRQFGGVDQLKEREREARGLPWLESFLRDLRFGARMLWKSPGFSLVAILTLAVGLGANITVFGLISFFFFTPMPVKDADRLVVMARQMEKFEMAAPLSWRDFLDYRAQVSEFSDALAVALRPAHLSQPGRSPDRTFIELVSGNYFTMAGVQPLHGRLFLPGEGEKPGVDPIVVLGHDYWQSKLGGDPRVVGETLMINAQPFRVVGITPPEFKSIQWALMPSAFIPATMAPTAYPGEAAILESRGWSSFKVFATLAPGATLDQARAAVDVVHARLVPEHEDPNEAKARMIVRPELLSRPDPSVASIMPFAAAVFMGLVLLVLLIACANVANLMFARALNRQREMGIRFALGGSRGRLLRQLVTESVLLSLIAGIVGFGVSYAAGNLMQRFAPSGEVPVNQEAGWDWNGVWFTIAVALFAGVVMGVVPALRATRVDVQTVLKGAPTEPGRMRHWFRNGLVLSQVSFCVIVLVCGGLFLRSLRQMAAIDLGLRPEGVVMASIDPGLNGYSIERARALIDEVTERVASLPGVERVAMGTAVPFSNTSIKLSSARRAQDEALTREEASANEVIAAMNHVEPAYVETLRVPLHRGRGFDRGDTAQSQPVAIINEALAERFWPSGDPLGQQIITRGDGVARTVVGVMGDGKYITLGEPRRPAVLLPLAQQYEGPLTLYVRAAEGVDPASLVSSLRQVFESVDPDLPLFEVRTMEEHLRTSALGYLPLRFAAGLAGVQGALGLFLAVLGIYGVVAYSVSQRTKEIGVRMALGAAPRDVLRLVGWSGLRLTLLGLALGLLAAVGLSHVLAGLLYGLNPLDGPVFLGTLILLLTVAMLACYVPARRALRVDPMIALRAE